MNYIYKLDTAIYYILLVYALSSSISIGGASITMYLALLLAIIRYIKEPFTMNLDVGLIKAIGIFIIAISVSSMFSLDVLSSLKRVSAIGTRIIPLLLAVAFIKDRYRLIALLIMLCCSMLIGDVYAVWQGVHGIDRPASFTSSYMVMAGYLVQMLPLILVFCFKDAGLSAKARLFMMGMGILSLIVLGSNGTRGAWIAVAVVFMLYGVLHMRKKPKKLVAFLFVLVLISIIAVNIPGIYYKLATITDVNYQSNSERVLIWQSAWQMFLDHPATGIGLGQFSDLYRNQYISPLAKEPNLMHAHNNVLQFLAETGLIGTVAFIYLFGFIMVQNYKRYVRDSNMWALSLLLVTISFLVQGLTEYNFGHLPVIRMYWFIAGLTYVAWNLEKSTKQ